MKACPQCKEAENDDDERFCMSCGADMDGAGPDINTVQACSPDPSMSNEVTHIIRSYAPGSLTIDGKTLTIVDDSQRLIGRADLRHHTKGDLSLISRSHFTVYRKELSYVIKDGVTSVQDKPSKEGTLLNGELLDGEAELKSGDKIMVSDIEITFEV